jgi:transcriptional regulator with XRE-family HTH domain
VDAHEGLPWRQALGEQIREARKRARVTQETLAKAVGLRHRNMIGRYEAGDDAPNVQVLGNIALQLGMTEVNINGYRYLVQQRIASLVPETAEQLRFDFDKEYVFRDATLKITATKHTITITAAAPAPPMVATPDRPGVRRSG